VAGGIALAPGRLLSGPAAGRSSRTTLFEDTDIPSPLGDDRRHRQRRQFRQSEFGQAAIRLAADLRPQAHWLRQHATIEAS
jgi:hypothetical protein